MAPSTAAIEHPGVRELLMLYRPLSQLLRIMVEPELAARLNDGRLRREDLPVQVQLLRMVWGASPAPPVVEMNQEVNLRAEVKVTRAGITAGEQLTLADVDPNECYVLPPEIGGERASFFLGASLYLNMFTMFDFTANTPGGPSAERMRYPIAEVVRAVQLVERVRPKETFAALAAADCEFVLSRRLMLFPKHLLDLILGFIERDLMKNTDDVVDPGQQVNRDGIAHGIFAGFETRDIALKYLILLDSLAFVVFHDRLVAGTL
jgi:hypothetical protein